MRRLAEGCLHSLGGRFGLRRVLNVRGSPLSLSDRQAVTVWLAVVACLAPLLALAPLELGAHAAVGLGLALGGATSNLADRIARGGVVDFIALGRWPAFNLADAAMVAGAALAAWSLL